jgi:hypothetical protein
MTFWKTKKQKLAEIEAKLDDDYTKYYMYCQRCSKRVQVDRFEIAFTNPGDFLCEDCDK